MKTTNQTTKMMNLLIPTPQPINVGTNSKAVSDYVEEHTKIGEWIDGGDFMKGLYDASKAEGNRHIPHPYLELIKMYEETDGSLDTRWCKLIIGDYTTQAIPLPTLHRHRQTTYEPGATLAGILDISITGEREGDEAWAGTRAQNAMKETPLIEMNSITCNHNQRLLENLIGLKSNQAFKEGKLHYYNANTLNCLVNTDGEMEQHRWEEFCLRDAGKEMWEEGYDTKPIVEMMKNTEMYENVVKLVKTRILSHKNFIKGALGDRTVMGKLIVKKYQECAGELITDFWDRYGMRFQKIQSKECIFNYHLKCSQHSMKRLPEQIFYQELKNGILEIDEVDVITMGQPAQPGYTIMEKRRMLYIKIKDEYAIGKSDEELEKSSAFIKVRDLFQEFCYKMSSLSVVDQTLQTYPRRVCFHCVCAEGMKEFNPFVYNLADDDE